MTILKKENKISKSFNISPSSIEKMDKLKKETKVSRSLQVDELYNILSVQEIYAILDNKAKIIIKE